MDKFIKKEANRMAAVKEKRVEDSMIEQVHKLRPTHMNGMGRLFGGQLMS